MSFRWKIILSMTAIQVVMLSILSWTSLKFLRESNENEILNRVATTTNLFATTSKDAVLATDLATLESFTREILKNPGIEYIRILGSSDENLAESGNEDVLNLPFVEDTSLEAVEDQIFDTQAKIEESGILYGTIQIGFAIDQIRQIIWQAQIYFLQIAALDILIIIFFSFILGQLLTQQLDNFVDASKRITAGELGYQIPVKGHDELAQAASMFNRMSQELQANHVTLQDTLNLSLRQNQLLNTVSLAQSRFIADIIPSDIFEGVLKNLLALTQSEYGFIGEVLYTDEQQPYLKTHAITNIAWNEETRALYDKYASTGMEFYNLNTLFGTVMTTQQTVMANDPAHDPRRGGLPEGPPALHAFLGIPFFSGKKMVGMIGIANRPEGYNEELVTFLQPILRTCASIIVSYRNDQQRQQAEHALKDSEIRTRTIVESAVDGILTIDEHGIIESLNPGASRIFDYSAEEVIGQNVSMLMPSPHRENHNRYIHNYLNTGTAKIIGIGREVQGQRRDGSLVPVYLSVSEMQLGSRRMFLGILRDITELKQVQEDLQTLNKELEQRIAERTADLEQANTQLSREIVERKQSQELLRQLAEKLSMGTGEELFRSLSQFLAEILHTDYAFIGQISEDTEDSVTILCVLAHGQPLENFSYTLAGTPCEMVIDKQACLYPQKVQQLFPEDTMLADMNAESYFGFPLFNSSNVPLGLMAVLHTQPLQESGFQKEYVLQILAARISSEIERMDQEKQIRMFSDAVRQSLDGIIITNLAGDVVFCNESAMWMFGYEKEDLIGQHGQMLTVPPETASELIIPAIQQRGGWAGELDMRRKDGTIFPAAMSASLLRDEQDTPFSMLGVIRDISERKQAEEALRKAYDDLELRVKERTVQLSQANYSLQQEIAERKRAQVDLYQAKEVAESASRAKSNFLANMSHELRTPLNAVLGYAQILKGGSNLTERQKEGLDTIKRSGDHLLKLINEILDLSKIEAGRMELVLKDIHFSNFLKHIAEMIQIRAIHKDISFTYEGDPRLPAGIRTDEHRLRQVLLNLLENAVKFTEKGQVILRVTRVEAHISSPETEVLHSVSHILFHIEDTGLGIASENLEEIFLPFQQASEQRYAVEGTGLGLAISRQLVRKMGGELQVSSEIGKGSSFWFELSFPEVSEVVMNTTPETLKISGYRGKRRKALVVDDHRENRAVLINMLYPLGFEILEAENGRECLEKAEEAVPDVILLDLRMPIMNGIEAARHLRQMEMLKETVIIAISASVLQETQQENLDAGCDDFLIKPFELESLLALFSKHVHVEWIYEDMKQEKIEPDVEEADKHIPLPPEENDILIELARRGSAKRMLAKLQELEQQNTQYLPIVQQLRHLIKQYQFDELIKELEKQERQDHES